MGNITRDCYGIGVWLTQYSQQLQSIKPSNYFQQIFDQMYSFTLVTTAAELNGILYFQLTFNHCTLISAVPSKHEDKPKDGQGVHNCSSL